MWEMVLIWFQIFLRLASMLQIHGTRSRTQGRSTAECGAAVLSRAARVQRRKVALSGNKQSMPSAGFQSRAPNDSLRRETESSGPPERSYKVARDTGAKRRARDGARRRPRTPAVPLHAVGAAPELRTRRAVSKMKKQLHVHPVVDLLVVLGFLPRADARDVVAPVGVARSWIIISSPLRRLIDETHLLLVLICQ